MVWAIKTVRMVGHGVADVFSFGLWEVVGTPSEAICNGHDVAVKITFDSTNHAKDINIFKNKVIIMKNIFPLVLISLIIVGCAPSGPSAISIDSISSQRNQVAVLRLQQRMGFFILACDNERVIKIPNLLFYNLEDI